jgi:hypothetical protein
MTVLDRSYLWGSFRTLKNALDIKRTLEDAYDAEGTLKDAEGTLKDAEGTLKDAEANPRDAKGTVFERIGTGRRRPSHKIVILTVYKALN